LNALKEVLLTQAVIDLEEEEEESNGSLRKSTSSSTSTSASVPYRDLPSFDKFAAGMPTVVWEENAPPTGRLNKVLRLLKQKKKTSH
jgi:hypothetical protein